MSRGAVGPPNRRPRHINSERVAQRVVAHRSSQSDCCRLPAKYTFKNAPLHAFLRLTKRLEMLRVLLPNVAAIGLIVNPDNPNTRPSVQELQALAQTGGWRLHVVNVRTGSEIDTAVETLAQLRAGAFLTATDNVINSRSGQLVALAARYGMPAIYQRRQAVDAGGLISYSTDNTEVTRIVACILAGFSKAKSQPICRSSSRPSSSWWSM